jgi:hypothetical protein
LAVWLVCWKNLYISHIIFIVLGSILVIIFVSLGLGLLALIWTLWRSKTVPSLQNIMYSATNALYPLALLLGKWLGVSEERIKNSYIQVSNHLVKTKIRARPIQRILILAPHCLQWVQCPYKITMDVNNCHRCGHCLISDLLAIAESYRVELCVVTGGTSARSILKKTRPEGIVAIACERDLTSGIQDAIGMLVIGIVNERPEGPCLNTRVDLQKVVEAIKYFQQGG